MRRTRVLPLLVLAAGLLASTTIGLAQDPGVSVASYLQGLARIRGVTVPPVPTIVMRTEEETRQLLVAGLERGLPPSWWESQEKALRKFALIPPDFRVKPAVIDLLSEMILAYFDFHRQELVLRRAPASAEDQGTVIHELVHALQNALFDARGFLDLGPGRGDEALARRAVLEGEAQALMLDLLLAPQGKDISKLPDLAVLGRMSLPPLPSGANAIPRFLREQLVFPYLYGLEFVRQFRLRHPWKEFSRLYHDPPRSTAEILYPQRYLLFRKDPTVVRLPDLAHLLGAGWRLIKEDDLGALGTILVLQAFLDDARARRLAEEWEGDRYQLYEDGGGRLALIVLSAWRLQWRANDFAVAYHDLLKKKYPGLTGGPGASGALRFFKAGEDAITVEHRGRHILILEGPPPDREATLRDAVWRSRPAP